MRGCGPNPELPQQQAAFCHGSKAATSCSITIKNRHKKIYMDTVFIQFDVFPCARVRWCTCQMLGCHTAYWKRGIYLWPVLMFICVSGKSSCPLSGLHSFRWKSTATVLVLQSDWSRGRVFKPSAAARQELPNMILRWRRTSPQEDWESSFLLYCTTLVLACTGEVFFFF